MSAPVGGDPDRALLRSDCSTAGTRARPPAACPCAPSPARSITESGPEVVHLQQHVQGDGGEHQRGNECHEQSPAVRRYGAREGWTPIVAAGLQSFAVIVNCDELHASRDELSVACYGVRIERVKQAAGSQALT